MFSFLHTVAAVLTGKFDLKSEKGATAVEYAIMVAGIAITIIAIVFLLGDQISSLFSSVSASLAGA